MGMREWLIALGILVIVAILLDGVRRMRNTRRDVQSSLFADENRGTTRVAAHGGRSAPSSDIKNQTQNVSQLRAERQEPDFSDDFFDGAIDDISVARVTAVRVPDTVSSTQSPIAKPVFGDPTFATPVFDTATTPLGLGESAVLSKPRVYERPADQPAPRREPPVIKESKPVVIAQQERAMRQQEKQQQDKPVSEEPLQKPPQETLEQALPQQKKAPQQRSLVQQEVIVISVMARTGLPGAKLLEILLANGLRYGDRNIFHYYSSGDEGEENSLYSVVNAVNPGSFDLNNMRSFHTPGVSLFLTLPTPSSAMAAFDSMLTTARAIAEQLQGELRDENRSVMTHQTVEHCRQRIRDFEMHSRLPAR